jgi:predicted nuclease with TOPRIM domain
MNDEMTADQIKEAIATVTRQVEYFHGEIRRFEGEHERAGDHLRALNKRLREVEGGAKRAAAFTALEAVNQKLKDAERHYEGAVFIYDQTSNFTVRQTLKARADVLRGCVDAARIEFDGAFNEFRDEFGEP